MSDYKLLDLEPGASLKNINSAFRKKQFEYHPDRNPTGQAHFIKITNAYETIINGINHSSESNTLTNTTVPYSIYHLTITMQNAFFGTSIPIYYTRSTIEHNNTTTERETLYIDIEPGIDNNEIIIIKKKGNIINNSQGDIKLIINIDNATPFIRKGLDLYLKHTISLKDSICGFKHTFRHLDNMEYNINNISGNIISPSYTKILPNLGIRRKHNIGNLIISFDIQFPIELPGPVIKQLHLLL